MLRLVLHAVLFHDFVFQLIQNRYCHIKYNEKVAIKSQKSSDNVATKEKSSDIILNYLKENDSIDCVKAFEKSQEMIMKVILNGWESRIWILLILIKVL